RRLDNLLEESEVGRDVIEIVETVKGRLAHFVDHALWSEAYEAVMLAQAFHGDRMGAHDRVGLVEPFEHDEDRRPPRGGRREGDVRYASRLDLPPDEAIERLLRVVLVSLEAVARMHPQIDEDRLRQHGDAAETGERLRQPPQQDFPLVVGGRRDQETARE